MKEYKAYLFDADGTLIDTADMLYACFKNTIKHYKNTIIEKETVFNLIGLPLIKQFEILLGPLTDKEMSEAVQFHKTFQESIYSDYLKLCPGVKETLIELKKLNKKIAVVTSRHKESLLVYLKTLEIFDYFDEFITPLDTKKHKPEAEPTLKALELLNTKAQDALFIGDAIFDIKSGDSAGTDTAFVSWSKVDPETLSVKPTYILKDTTDILDFN